jgi:hypothetical protein
MHAPKSRIPSRRARGVQATADLFAQAGDERPLAVHQQVADVRTSGFVQASLDRANVAGVKVAPEPQR